MGKVYLAGAGPWDERLVTEGCVSVLRLADTVVYDNLVNPSILRYAPDAELIYAGKRAGNHHLPQEEINALLVRLAKEGKTVVRLKGGDPYVFGRGGEEVRTLIENGVDFEVISGVSSCYGVPSSAGIAVTNREYSSSFHVFAGHGEIDFKTAAAAKGTLVFLMGKSSLSRIAEELIKNGKSPGERCAVISEGTSSREKCVSGTLEDIAEKAAQLPTPAVIVVGAAAGNILSPKEKSGKRVIVAGKVETLGGLHESGADILRIPLIKSRRLTEVKSVDFSGFNLIAFASREGVRAFFDYIGDVRKIGHVKYIAAAGDATALELKRYGITADIVPKKVGAAGILEETGRLTDKISALLPCSVQSPPTLCEGLRSAGAYAERLELYSTEADFSRKELLNLYEKTADSIILTSPTCVDAFMAMTEGTNAELRAIGGTTERYLKNFV